MFNITGSAFRVGSPALYAAEMSCASVKYQEDGKWITSGKVVQALDIKWTKIYFTVVKAGP